MIRIAILVGAALAGCAKPYPYEPAAGQRAAEAAACHVDAPATETNKAACTKAAEWLDFQGQTANALALHQRLCEMGTISSCAVIFQRRKDPAAAWQVCAAGWFGGLEYCRRSTSAAPAHDPRRLAAMELYCKQGEAECVELVGIELSSERADWQFAADLCRTASADPDASTCEMITTAAWGRPAVAEGLAYLREKRGCARTVASLCVAAAQPFDAADREQIAARAELLARGCARGDQDACGQAIAHAADQQARIGCRAGDTPACERVGAEAARRARLSPGF